MDLSGSQKPQSSKALTIWAVSDGRIGIENQALGLAEAVARLRPAEVVRKHVAFTGLYDRLPSALKFSPHRFLKPGSDRIAPPWPDLWIGAGRATLPFAVRMRRWSGGRTFVVQVQDPRWPARLFDLVMPPEHDGLTGENVLPIIGSPHRVTPERLAEEAAGFAQAIDALPRPRIAVLIGGTSKSNDLTETRARSMAQSIAAAVREAGGSVMVTFSRRTPEAAEAVLSETLGALPGVVWRGDGPNPYFAFLAAADHILVTEDSTNMVTEAASTGTPVSILAMDGGSPKFARFHRGLQQAGITRPFDGRLERWTYAPLRETDRAADEVVRRMSARSPS